MEFILQLSIEFSYLLVLLFDLHTPLQISDRIFMAAEDVAFLIDSIQHVLDIVCHLLSIAFKESADSSDEKSVSSESAGL